MYNRRGMNSDNLISAFLSRISANSLHFSVGTHLRNLLALIFGSIIVQVATS